LEQKEFVTPNLYLSAAIATLTGLYPSFKVKNGKTLFIFPANDVIYMAMSDYNNGALGNLYEHDEMIKRLRAEMIIRRDQK